MGAYISLKLALARPDLVRRLVLVVATAGVDMSRHGAHDWRASDRPHTLIDVRQPDEHSRERIDHSKLIPLPTLESHLDDLPRDRPIVVHCQSGGRSARATALLREKGFDARNLVGGINAWRRHAG